MNTIGAVLQLGVVGGKSWIDKQDATPSQKGTIFNFLHTHLYKVSSSKEDDPKKVDDRRKTTCSS